MNGYDVYSVYQAIKLHFTSKDYNFFTYNGKTRVSVDAFQKRKDKYNFHKLARKYSETEIVPFFVANFAYNDSQWSKSLLQDDAEELYATWKKITEAMSYNFISDIKLLMENRTGKEFNDLFKVTNGEYPVLLTKVMQKEVSLETLVILDKLFNVIAKWDKQIEDTFIYPKLSMKIKKYGAFLNVDTAKYKSQLKGLLFTTEDI
jgi:hypothetical protein